VRHGRLQQAGIRSEPGESAGACADPPSQNPAVTPKAHRQCHRRQSIVRTQRAVAHRVDRLLPHPMPMAPRLQSAGLAAGSSIGLTDSAASRGAGPARAASSALSCAAARLTSASCSTRRRVCCRASSSAAARDRAAASAARCACSWAAARSAAHRSAAARSIARRASSASFAAREAAAAAKLRRLDVHFAAPPRAPRTSSSMRPLQVTAGTLAWPLRSHVRSRDAASRAVDTPTDWPVRQHRVPAPPLEPADGDAPEAVRCPSQALGLHQSGQ
jgi:hypothetical protein